MPTNTYVPLGTITLASTDSEIVFSSIPATYRDLIVVADVLATGGAPAIRGVINSDTGNNYYSVFMRGNGSTAASGLSVNGDAGFYFANYTAEPTSSNRAIFTNQFMDYSATDKQKTILIRANNAADSTEAAAARWASTSAITSIAIKTSSDSFAIGSTFSLYGVN